MSRLLLCLVLLAAGCRTQHPWPELAHAGLAGAAHALAAADAVAAEEYAARADRIINEGGTGSDLDALDAQFAPILTALRAARASLLIAEREVDSAAEVADAPARCRAGLAVAQALEDVRAAVPHLRGAGVDVPDSIPAAALALEPVARDLLGACPADGAPR